MIARTLLLLLLIPVLASPAQVLAQGSQVAEDQDVGVRLSIPKAWEWRKRDSNPRPSLFINCMPQVTSTYPCYLLVEYFNAPAGQTAIEDADRRKWESWYSASGTRTISATRDLKLAGNPSFEISGREAQGKNPERSLDIYVLVPAAGRVYRLSYKAFHDGKEYFDQYKPAIDAALQSFAILPRTPAATKGTK